MAQIPLEAGMAGKAPVVSSAIPRAQHRVLRETAAARGLTVSGLLRLLIGLSLDGMSQEDDHDSSMQEARGHHTPGSLNADYQRHQLGSNDRTPTCPTISPTITAAPDG